MNPIGQYIKIHQPEPVNKYCFLVEQEPISKAEVVLTSPDTTVPFSEKSTVYFYTGRHIVNKYGIFIPLEYVTGWQ
jgi:hypothetical protein